MKSRRNDNTSGHKKDVCNHELTNVLRIGSKPSFAHLLRCKSIKYILLQCFCIITLTNEILDYTVYIV
nr:MAG TPA: hypothetical protein [Caudoviricetes sp.]